MKDLDALCSNRGVFLVLHGASGLSKELIKVHTYILASYTIGLLVCFHESQAVIDFLHHYSFNPSKSNSMLFIKIIGD